MGGNSPTSIKMVNGRMVRVPYIPMAKQIAMKKEEEAKKIAEAVKLEAQQAAMKKAEKAKVAPEQLAKDLGRIPPHGDLTLNEVNGRRELTIDLDFIRKGRDGNWDPTNIKTMNDILPRHAPHVTSVIMNLRAQHPSNQYPSLSKRRISQMKKLFSILDTFKLQSLHISILINTKPDFAQMKLAAGVYGLRFEKWTMSYIVQEEWDALGDDEVKEYRVWNGSIEDRRLAGVFRVEFEGSLEEEER